MLKPLTYITFTLILFFLMLYGFLKLSGPIPFEVSSTTLQKTDTFNVTGEGKASIKPDQATVTVGVTAQAPTAKAAQDQMNAQINKVADAIKALGIEAKDIQTENYNVNPEYDYRSGTQSIKDYMANTTMVIKARKIDDANKVLDTAVANGATNAGGVSFDNADSSKAEDEARTKAVEDAKKKAQTAAKIAGFQLGKLVNYQENNGGGIIRPMAMDAALPKAGGGTPTQIEPGQNEVTIQVTLSYEVK